MPPGDRRVEHQGSNRAIQRGQASVAPIESACCRGGIRAGSGAWTVSWEVRWATNWHLQPLPAAFSALVKAALLVSDGVRLRTVPPTPSSHRAFSAARSILSLLLPDTNDNRLGLRFG